MSLKRISVGQAVSEYVLTLLVTEPSRAAAARVHLASFLVNVGDVPLWCVTPGAALMHVVEYPHSLSVLAEFMVWAAGVGFSPPDPSCSLLG